MPKSKSQINGAIPAYSGGNSSKLIVLFFLSCYVCGEIKPLKKSVIA
jgi:hypothetical protein